ncbi:MBL fold metallo-hydrolase [Jongsikchunia kroppenstedtii]|uniref:MBL fold metallo-hydrolase n=1 Tax=Jongsikchunia kroppenstedtii TaxID=1121721 RepID=UPI0003693006|nr:MBL fold metallo-hydrolase [Jongsikchunia kroppenstedtii]
MKVHHLNCGTMAMGTVDHCLLVELPAGDLLLVDSGFGLDCVRRPQLLGLTRHAIRPALDESETAIRQIETLGLDPKDVRNIVVTHLDYDHTSGLADFPWATVHVHAPEYRAGMHPTVIERIRYRPDQLWAHGVQWRVNQLSGGDGWFGFEAVRDLPGLPEEVLVVPLLGHSRGHAGVAIDTGAGWLLHAGDAYTTGGAVSDGAAGAFARAMHPVLTHPTLPSTQFRNMRRLAELKAEHSDEVTVFCSHDKSEFDRLVAVG